MTKLISIKTKPASDCRSDHKMLQAKFRISLHNKINTNGKIKLKPKELEKLSTPQTKLLENSIKHSKNWIIDAVKTTIPK